MAQNKTYAAVPFGDGRFAIADTNTGEILDDAQGYGYKTAQKAYAAYGYKSNPQRNTVDSHLVGAYVWLKKQPGFAALDDLMLDAYKTESPEQALLNTLENAFPESPYPASLLLEAINKAPAIIKRRRNGKKRHRRAVHKKGDQYDTTRPERTHQDP